MHSETFLGSHINGVLAQPCLLEVEDQLVCIAAGARVFITADTSLPGFTSEEDMREADSIIQELEDES